MSDNDMELDDEELESLYEGQSSEDMDPEDVFKMVLINKVRKKRTYVELQDADGDIVQLKDVIKELLTYIKDKTKDEAGNQFTDQIMPLMAQAVVSGLGRMIGIPTTAFMLSDDTTKYSLINMMCVSFLLLKFVQQKELTIHTYEEDVSDEEIATLERKNQANKNATLASLAGEDPKAVLRKMREEGLITDNDLTDMLGDSHDSTETTQTNSNNTSNRSNKKRN